MMNHNQLPIAIIGGGPVGLAAAAHLVNQNQPFVLFESGSRIGHNLLSWAHVRVFSPWKYNLDKVAVKLLQQQGWQTPDEDGLPTGASLVEDYLEPLSNLPQLKPYIVLNAKVVQINRKGLDKVKTKGREAQPFVIQVEQGEEQLTYEAKAVIDASGTWQNPNPLGTGGNFALGEQAHADHIFYGIPEVLGKNKARFANKNTLVVGGGHSAINSILDLRKLVSDYPETEIHWVLRKENLETVFGGKEKDSLAARGALGKRIEKLVRTGKVKVYTPFQITEIHTQANGRLQVVGQQQDALKALENIDQIICNTGARPDFSFLREIRYNTDAALESVPALAPLIDPNVHSCGTVRPHGEAELRQPEKDFYVVGSKSYGRAPTFLMATGYEQVRSIVAALVGNWEAARQVQLNLPETGVCSNNLTQKVTEPASEELLTQNGGC
ncbi:MAG TPA: flavoprotein [Microscillaceae bacterium]|nr:flavoprotein [Microscillaceae bacterium]